MKVTLEYHTPLSIMVSAGRQCWDSYHRGGCYDQPTDEISDADREFLDRIVNKHKHESVSEHVTYNFRIQGITRAVLQELARHRMANLSVRSTRYTLSKDFKETQFFTKVENGNEIKYENINIIKLDEFFNLNEYTEEDIVKSLCPTIDRIQERLNKGEALDKIKYLLPESYRTSLFWTINSRSLRNFLKLRTSKAALKEIQQLAFNVFQAVPREHSFLYNFENETE